MIPTLTRRVLVRTGFVAIGSSALLARNPLARALAATPRPAGGRPWSADNGRRLVVVQLRGGNDGLNTVVPFADPRYRSLRPTLALEQDLVQIDSGVALNPGLAALAGAWQSGELAIVRGVGYPDPDLSHFRSEAIWHTADPVSATGPGWLGRWADSLPVSPPALLTSVGAIPSPSTTGAGAVPAAVRDPDTFGYDLVTLDEADSALRRELLRAAFANAVGGGDAAALAGLTGLAVDHLVELVGTVPTEDGPPVSYPDGALGADLATAARLLAADLGTRVVWITTGGYDTHASQVGTHSGLLTDLADALSSFRADLDLRGLTERTAIVVWSEFGRRPAENGSHGTDHGTASNVLLLGRPVRGGLYGAQPALDDLDSSGNLKYTIDFRMVYETLLAEHLGVDPRLALPETFDRLDVLY